MCILYKGQIKYLLLLMIMLLGACKKDFLNTKPDQSLLIPKTLPEFQALLDNINIMNSSPSLGVIASDEYSVKEPHILTWGNVLEKGVFLWDRDPFLGERVYDWNSTYEQVFYANIALDGLEDMNPHQQESKYKQIKGSALFFRALAFYNLTQLFCLPYKEASAGTDLGIILKLQSDVQQKAGRSTVKQSYDLIISDLQLAASTLETTATIKTRPSKQAALALLARVYLSKGDYQNALQASNECLKISDELLNYNDLDATSNTPFLPAIPPSGATGNKEVIFYSTIRGSAFVDTYSTMVSVSSETHEKYESDDLRKSLFFVANNEVINFKGSYTGYRGALFSGLAIDEVILIRAEAYARLNDPAKALADLNSLLKMRTSTVSYRPLDISDTHLLLTRIFLERQRELYLRGTRWTDLRRLNLETEFQAVLRREVGATILTLQPNDARYVFPIPAEEINNSNLVQNPR